MKRALALVFVSVSLLVAQIAHAAPYLDVAALLLDDSRRGVSWVERRLHDKQLIETAHRLSEARVQAARLIEVPKNADRAHPHLLLALETTERAFFAATSGDMKRFLRLVRQAREEERTYRELLQQSKMTLPELERSRPSPR